MENNFGYLTDHSLEYPDKWTTAEPVAEKKWDFSDWTDYELRRQRYFLCRILQRYTTKSTKYVQRKCEDMESRKTLIETEMVRRGMV